MLYFRVTESRENKSMHNGKEWGKGEEEEKKRKRKRKKRRRRGRGGGWERGGGRGEKEKETKQKEREEEEERRGVFDIRYLPKILSPKYNYKIRKSLDAEHQYHPAFQTLRHYSLNHYQLMNFFPKPITSS
jgi:hypothetical protein